MLQHKMKGTAELCEARYIRRLKRSTQIEIPSELNFCPEIQAPKRKEPAVLRSLRGELERNVETLSASADIFKDLTSAIPSEELSILLSRNTWMGEEIQTPTLPCSGNRSRRKGGE